MTKTKLKIGITSAVLMILTIVCFILFKTSILTHNSNYISGHSTETYITNSIETLKDEKSLLVFYKQDSKVVDHIIDCVFDSPDLFWIKPKYYRLNLGDYEFLLFKKKYNINEAKAEIDKQTESIINDIVEPDMSDYEKTLAIHDWICKNVSYEQADDTSDQDIYGALVNRKALCAGYAEAFSYLLGKVGVKSSVVSGDAIDKNGNRISHAWNIVYINGKPYYFDITWDDFNNKIVYDWFGLPLNMFSYSHFPSTGYEWVDSTGVDACCYAKKGMYISKYSPEIISRQIAQQGRTFTIMCEDKAVYNEVINAIQNKEELLQIMRLSGIASIENPTYLIKRNSLCITITL